MSYQTDQTEYLKNGLNRAIPAMNQLQQALDYHTTVQLVTAGILSPEALYKEGFQQFLNRTDNHEYVITPSKTR